MRDRIFVIGLSILFVGIMLWCPGMTILENASIITLPQSKNLKQPEKMYEGEGAGAYVLNSIEKGKAGLENVYTNSLPFYEKITSLMLDGERAMRDTMWAAFMPQGDAPSLGEEDLGTRYVAKRVGKDDWNIIWAITEEGKPYSEGWTDKTLIAGDAELRERLERQLGHVHRIANANEDVNFYVYVGTRFQDTEIFGEIVKDIPAMRNEVSTNAYLTEFLSRLDPQAVDAYDIFDIDSVELRLERIFRTDHHETAQGAYDIYSDIVQMIQSDAPGIVDAYPLRGIYTFEDVVLMGSHVWGTKYSEISESFSDYLVNLPGHYLRSWDAGMAPRDFEGYRNGNHIKFDFTDHYGVYYPRPGVVTYPGNDTGRNLLILGDSYCWAAGELIAASFDDTYIVSWTHDGINYNEFIREKGITDVLVFQVADRLLFDIQNDTQLGRVFTGR